MRVQIPTSLRSYTQVSRVEAVGTMLGAVLADLDRQFPGIRLRMVDKHGRLRPHTRVFVNGRPRATHAFRSPLQVFAQLLSLAHQPSSQLH